MADGIVKLLESVKNPEHPMLKVMKAACDKAKLADKNGNYKVYSDEIGEKYPPHFSATIQKQGGKYSFLEIKNISNGVVFSEKAAHNIIISEMELSKYPDQIPTEDAFKIAQKITTHGKIIRLAKEDRQKAMENAKRIVVTEKLPDMPKAVKNEIINAAQWDLLSDGAKSLIAAQWARKIGGKTMVVVNDDETTDKEKLRALILYIQKEA
ncbi:MAG: hypothetical protein HY051_02755 [Candidatus Aenigmarchaeota archaeon]|nr:hypothetical protein [Candidatus Aenigmarchaeota archaeon]